MGGSKARIGFPPNFSEPTSEGHPVCRTALSTRSRTQRAQRCPDPTALLLHTDPEPVNLEPVTNSRLYVILNKKITRTGGSQW